MENGNGEISRIKELLKNEPRGLSIGRSRKVLI
jgi:hypothetical protein